MARRRSLSEMLRQTRQFEAVTGRPLTTAEIRGIAEPTLEQQRIEDIQMTQFEREQGLRERALSEEIRAQQEAARAQSLSGYLSAAGTAGGALLQTEAGKRFTEGIGTKIFGKAAESTATKVASSAAAPAVSTGGAAGIGTQAIAPSLATTTTPSVTAMIAPQAAETAATGATAATAASAALLPSAIGGGIGQLVTGGEGGVPGAVIGGGTSLIIASALGATGIGLPIAAVLGAIGGGKMICTELCRQGYLSIELLKLDGEFRNTIDDEVYAGYAKAATPIVKLMKRSKLFTKIVSLIALPWAYEMAHQMKPEVYKSNKFGKVVMDVGIPFCRFLGRRRWLTYSVEL